MFRNVIVAGTFNALHLGHQALLRKALSSGKRITIGLTSDSFAKKKSCKTNSFSERKRRIERFLGKNVKKARIVEINDRFDASIRSEDFDAIVVSKETKRIAVEINKIRKRRKLKPLSIVLQQTVYASDFKRISCTRIDSGKINKHGIRVKQIKFSIGSENKDKVKGAKDAVSKFFGKCSVKGFKVKSRVKNQPTGEETIKGAINRAKAVFKDCDFSVGLESGLFLFRGTYYNIMWCALYDGKTVFLGSSMGFAIPDTLGKEAKVKTLSRAFEYLYGKKANGVIDVLSGKKLKRSEMAEQACSCSLLQLVNREIFITE